MLFKTLGEWINQLELRSRLELSNSVIASNLESGATVPQGTSNRKRLPNRSPVLPADIYIVPNALPTITVTVHDLPYPLTASTVPSGLRFKSQTTVNGYLFLLLPLERNKLSVRLRSH